MTMAPKRSGPMRIGKILKGRVVVVGVGNRLRGDDAVGPLLVDRLRRVAALTCIDAGSALENHLGQVIAQRPDTVLVVDAVHLDLAPGEYELLDPSRIQDRGLSTHDVSLKLSLDVLDQSIDGRVFLLGVQPEAVGFGAAVSEAVRRTLKVLDREISGAIASGVRTKSHRME